MFSKSKSTRQRQPIADTLVMWFLIITALGMALVLSGPTVVRAISQRQERERVSVVLPPLKGEANLFFASTESVQLFAPAIDKNLSTQRPIEAIQPTVEDVLIDFSPGTMSESKTENNPEVLGTDNGKKVGESFLSPDRRYIALQTYSGPTLAVWIIDVKDRAKPTLTRLTTEGYGLFLGWHPDSRHVLYLASDVMVKDAGLWLVNVEDGTHEKIEVPAITIPENITAAAISPDGVTVSYATTKGMGAGSELWQLENGKTSRKIWSDEITTVGTISYAPDGKTLLFTNLLDAPVPFANAGLWVLAQNDDKAIFLTTMDGGHGQLPLWSADGEEVYFVKRENADDTKADYEASSLISSIRAIRINDLSERTLVATENARQIDLSLTPSGDLLFASNRSNFLEIWIVSTKGDLRQITTLSSPKRYPLFVSPVQ